MLTTKMKLSYLELVLMISNILLIVDHFIQNNKMVEYEKKSFLRDQEIESLKEQFTGLTNELRQEIVLVKQEENLTILQQSLDFITNNGKLILITAIIASTLYIMYMAYAYFAGFSLSLIPKLKLPWLPALIGKSQIIEFKTGTYMFKLYLTNSTVDKLLAHSINDDKYLQISEILSNRDDTIEKLLKSLKETGLSPLMDNSVEALTDVSNTLLFTDSIEKASDALNYCSTLTS